MTTAAPPVVELHLPWLPASQRSGGNARGSWQAREAERVSYKQSCYVLVRQAMQGYEQQGVRFPLRGPLDASLTFVMPDATLRDLDNMLSRFKHGLDALCKARVVQSDDWRQIARLHLSATVGRRTEAGVIVRLQAVAEVGA